MKMETNKQKLFPTTIKVDPEKQEDTGIATQCETRPRYPRLWYQDPRQSWFILGTGTSKFNSKTCLWLDSLKKTYKKKKDKPK